jgi:hypothetical protein
MSRMRTPQTRHGFKFSRLCHTKMLGRRTNDLVGSSRVRRLGPVNAPDCLPAPIYGSFRENNGRRLGPGIDRVRCL